MDIEEESWENYGQQLWQKKICGTMDMDVETYYNICDDKGVDQCK